MKSAVTISLVAEAAGGPFVFWHDIPAAAARAKELGFDALEVFPPDGYSDYRDKLDDVSSQTQGRIVIAAMGTGAGWVKHKLTLTSPDATIRENARKFIRQIVATAACFNAPAIVGSMQGRSEHGVTRSQALNHLRDALNEIGEDARSRNQILLFEPLNRYETNLINTVQQGIELLASLETKNVRLLLDLFHTNIEEQDVAASIRLAGAAVGHIHLADSNRRAAGFGHTDFAPIIKALRDIHFTGYLSAEILPLPNSDAAAVQTIQAFKALTQ